MAQSAAFTDINIHSPKTNDTSASIKYPVVVINNVAVASVINKNIKKVLLDDNLVDTTINNTADALKQYAAGYLTDMDYTVTFNKNGILSLNVYLQVEGAYQWSYYCYFNFNLVTGESLSLSSIIKAAGYSAFRNTMLHYKQSGLKKSMQDTKKNLDSGYVDKDDYVFFLERIKEEGCMDSVSLQKFSLSANYIQVFNECGFPHAMRNIQPDYNLLFDIKKGRDMLNAEFFEKLSQ